MDFQQIKYYIAVFFLQKAILCKKTCNMAHELQYTDNYNGAFNVHCWPFLELDSLYN